MPEHEMAHVAVTLPKLDEAVEWYGAYMGFREIKRSEKAKLRLRKTALMDMNGALLEILQPLEPSAVRNGGTLVALLQRPGLNHIALTTDDVDSYYQRLQNSGATQLDYIEGKHLWVRDPYGISWEIRQR